MTETMETTHQLDESAVSSTQDLKECHTDIADSTDLKSFVEDKIDTINESVTEDIDNNAPEPLQEAGDQASQDVGENLTDDLDEDNSAESPYESDLGFLDEDYTEASEQVDIAGAAATLESSVNDLQEEEPTMSFKPDDMPQLMPYLVVANPEAAMTFYEKTFGFQREGEPLVQNGEVIHCEMTYMDTRIMIGLEGCWGNSARSPASSGIDQGIGLYIYCPDVDSHYSDAAASGAEVTMEPEDMFWGDRMYSAKDMDGYRWSFATKVGEFDPSKLPEDMQ